MPWLNAPQVYFNSSFVCIAGQQTKWMSVFGVGIDHTPLSTSNFRRKNNIMRGMKIAKEIFWLRMRSLRYRKSKWNRTYQQQQTCRPTERKTGKKTDRQTCRQTDGQTYMQTDRWQTDRQTDWQTDILTDRSIDDRATGRQAGRWQTYRQTDWRIYRLTVLQANRQTDRQTDRQIDGWQSCRQMYGPTDRQTDRLAHIQINR